MFLKNFNLVLVEELVGFYRGKTEEIINALLEDNLHPQVAALDRSLKSRAEIEKGKSKFSWEESLKSKTLESKKKTIIPGLYHKKAKKTAEDEVGNRKDQIFVNAVAKQYKYVVEEITVENKEETREDEMGVKYRLGSKIRDTDRVIGILVC